VPLAAGREVSTAWGMSGTFGRDHRVGWFTIPSDSTFEEDADDFRTIHATLAREVRIGETILAPGTRISVDPRGRVSITGKSGERWRLDPGDMRPRGANP